MKKEDLIAALETLPPGTRVLAREHSYCGDVEYGTIESVEPLNDEVIYCEKDGNFGYHRVPCVRLYV